MKKKEVKNYKCQIFTPDDYVDKLLDVVGYNQNIFDKTFLENSCGDGNVLTVAVKRYIAEGRRLNYSNEKIRKGLEKNIYGFEIDEDHLKKCIDSLNKIALSEGIERVNWNIYGKDYLKSKLKIKFDFIVGNPPYITYTKLSVDDRKYLKNNFNACKVGKFDYCYAFIEKSIDSLSEKGKMSYLIPSSIFKTVFGKNLREYMKPYICQIIDYTKDKIFDNALVKSAIIVFDKEKNTDSIIYTDESNHQKIRIFKDNLKDKWVFSDDVNVGERRFGDYFTVSHVVATLLNEAFVISDYEEYGDYYVVNGKLIEKEIVKDTTTPRTYRNGKQEKIIFPYAYDEKGKLLRYSEQEFKLKFKEAYKYLQSFKDKLDARTSESNVSWFEYGRSQALNKMNTEKLLIPIVITGKIEIQRIGETSIPYAGVFVTTNNKDEKYSLEYAKKLLESQSFVNYIENLGINISGSSFRITSKDIGDYYF